MGYFWSGKANIGDDLFHLSLEAEMVGGAFSFSKVPLYFQEVVFGGDMSDVEDILEAVVPDGCIIWLNHRCGCEG